MVSVSGIWELFQQGGIMMYFLLLASLAGLAIILEKAYNLRRPMVIPEPTKRALISMLDAGSARKALEYCRENPMPLTRLVQSAIVARPYGLDEMREAVMDHGRREASALERYLPLLGTIAAIAPLMGLMGTVLGMMETFEVIARVGPGRADELSGGISEALITTVTGLAIAVPALVFHNAFHARAGRYIQEMETFALHVMRTLREAEVPGVAQAAESGPAAEGVVAVSEPAGGDPEEPGDEGRA